MTAARVTDVANDVFGVRLDVAGLESTGTMQDGLVVHHLSEESFVLLRRTTGSDIGVGHEVGGDDAAVALLRLLAETDDALLCYATDGGSPFPPADRVPSGWGAVSGLPTLDRGVTALFRVPPDGLRGTIPLPDGCSVVDGGLVIVRFSDEAMAFSVAVTPHGLDWLSQLLTFARVEVGVRLPYTDDAAGLDAFLSAEVGLLSGDAEPNAAFTAVLHTDSTGVRGADFEITVTGDLVHGVEALAGLITDDAVRFPAGLPTPKVRFRRLGGSLSLIGGSPSVTELSGSLSAAVTGSSPVGSDVGPLAGLLTFGEIEVDFAWRKGGLISWIIAGRSVAQGFEVDLAYHHSGSVLTATIAHNEPSGPQTRTFFVDTLSLPEAAFRALDGVLTGAQVTLYADLQASVFEFRCRSTIPWKPIGGVEVDGVDVQFTLARVGGRFGVTEAELTLALDLPVGPRDGGGERSPVEVVVDAEYDHADLLWRFDGETGPGQEIEVGEAIEALIGALGGGQADNELPEAIRTLTVENIHLAFDSTGEAEFTCLTTLTIESQEVDFRVHLRRSSGTVQLAGSVFVHGLRLSVAFGSGSSGKVLVGSLSVPLVIGAKELVAALAPDVAAAVPIDVEVSVEGLLLAMHAGPGTENEYLLRLLFGIDLHLDGLPLVGGMLGDVGFRDGQLRVANRDWPQSDLAAVNALLPLFEPDAPREIVLSPDPAVGVEKGVGLSGTFAIGDLVTIPLSLQFGAGERSSDHGSSPAALPTRSDPAPSDGDETPSGDKAPTAESDAGSRSTIDRVVGAVRIRKAELVFEKGRLGLRITGGLALAGLEFDLIGVQVSVPQKVLSDPSAIRDVEFGLAGMGADIQKGRLSIQGMFARVHHEGGGDEYAGLIRVSMAPFTLVGMGSYTMLDGHPSLFLFAALNYPIPVHPSLLIEGLALGFGVHRDIVLPKVDDVATYPLVAVSSTPPTIDVANLATTMYEYFPPAADSYFVVAGVKFKAFSIVETIAMLVVKFGHGFELGLIGLSSVRLPPTESPSTVIELAWTATVDPERGYLSIAGKLTPSSHLFVPNARLTGGFAVAAWTAGEHRGDFVVSVGGYHPRFPVPAHYPDHLDRLGVDLALPPITVKGGAYFAVTPRCVMIGGSLEASLTTGIVDASLRMSLDAIVFFDPFHYDLEIDADAHVRATVDLWLTSIQIDVHVHVGLHVWGPDFSGTAALDVGPKTFEVAFGAGGPAQPLPLDWATFRTRFLQTVDSKGDHRDNVVSLTVVEGLLQVRPDGPDDTVHVVDGRTLVVEVRSTVPLPDVESTTLGISPMGVRGGGYEATLDVGAERGYFADTDITEAVPAAIWGGDGLAAPDPSSASDGLVRGVRVGKRLTPGRGVERGDSHPLPTDRLAYNTDPFSLPDHDVTGPTLTRALPAGALPMPTETFRSFTGLPEALVGSGAQRR